MLSFSKAIAQGKTAQEALEDEQKKAKAAQEAEKKMYDETQAKAQVIAEAQAEQQAEEQHEFDLENRKVLAQKYEQMEIEEEKRDSLTSDSTSNFQVIADQAAEQNYAVNVYKGSGVMSGMLDQMEKDGETARVQRLVQ